MNKTKNKYISSNFLIYNKYGQVYISKKFLAKGTKRFYQYKHFKFSEVQKTR